MVIVSANRVTALDAIFVLETQLILYLFVAGLLQQQHAVIIVKIIIIVKNRYCN
jgi:hypothetical protein